MAQSKRKQIVQYLHETAPAAVDETLLGELKTRFAPVSSGTLRKALEEAGVAMTPMVEGVRQDSLNELERTLRALEIEYSSGDIARRRQIRSVVLTARTHAEWAVKRKPEKAEHVLWLQTWLRDPPLFPTWVALRLEVLAIESRSTQPE